ncbi:MAG: YceH family protein [Rhodothermales bacterium]
MMTDFDLDPAEVRVLGVLVEKELSTPDYYPMTLNALRQACNQKTNRDPVVAYSADDVQIALDTLKRRRLVGTTSGMSSRSTKYRHALPQVMDLGKAERAVMAVLLLRGPQTVGEIRARTGRMYEFESMDNVEAILSTLAEAREEQLPALVTALPVQPGRKEARYAHLLSGPPDLDALEAEAVVTTGSSSRLDALETEVASLKQQLTDLNEAFATFRSQFE